MSISILNSSFVNNSVFVDSDNENSGIVVVSPSNNHDFLEVFMSDVHFAFNRYPGESGGIIYIQTINNGYDLTFKNCMFQNNTSVGHGATLYVDNTHTTSYKHNSHVTVHDSKFHHNEADNSIVYISRGVSGLCNVTLSSVQFVNNVGTAIYTPKHNIHLSGSILCLDNFASNGAAFYFYQGTKMSTSERANVSFVGNAATGYGGAIYVDVDHKHKCESGSFFLCQQIQMFCLRTI